MIEMINRAWFAMLGFVVFAALACGGESAIGQEKPAAGDAPPPATQPTAEDLKKLEPGPEHEILKALVGDFDGEYETFAGFNAPMQKSKGTVTNKLIYGGRFLEAHYEGDAAGQHFTGQNLIGYDNYKKRYVGTAVNSGSTSIIFSEGAAGPDGKTITLEWEDKDQEPAHPFRTRVVTKIIDKDHYSVETTSIAPEYKEPLLVAKVTYTRR
jgi:hypothetical protein